VPRTKRAPQTQERLTKQVAGCLAACLRPRGAGVVLEAGHSCMTLRGVRALGATTITSALLGTLRADAPCRAEFFALAWRAGLTMMARRAAGRYPAGPASTTAQELTMSMETTYVIAGASLAGAKAAETLRAEGFTGPLLLIGAENERPYERPPLSKDYLLGKAERETIYVHPQQWYAAHDVGLRLGVAVTGIDPAAHEVGLADGSRMGYSKLLLAAGSSPRRLAVPGAGAIALHRLGRRARRRIRIDRTDRRGCTPPGPARTTSMGLLRAAGDAPAHLMGRPARRDCGCITLRVDPDALGDAGQGPNRG
jgi:GTP cyclohydrolase I/Pyridine nucleotide-disulphide oxidoreductase